jgi:hypothetical protein
VPFDIPPPPAAAVSYCRDVAPIFAMHCNSCHGEAGGLSLRTYNNTMRGGNLGAIVIPGNADGSLLLHFLDGRRGDAHRMPKDGRPLSTGQIDVIRRWIDEGAKSDNRVMKTYRFARQKVAVDSDRITRIYCRVNTEAYLVISARDPHNGRTLWSDVASLKTHKEGVDAGEPGQLISWDIRAGERWPSFVTIELSIRYAAGIPKNTQLYTQSGLTQ